SLTYFSVNRPIDPKFNSFISRVRIISLSSSVIVMSAISAALSSMPAAVLPSAIPSPFADHPVVIKPAAPRKRRREIENCLAQGEEEDSDETTVRADPAASAYDLVLPTPLVAARPIVTVLPSRGGGSSNKRPQLKYDPSVPMTREQTSAWRREQRRKRNRESAAACRRRQRELVSVLEVEVASWRQKFERALAQVRTRDGEDAAAVLEAELERTFVLQPRKTTDDDCERCDTPPPPPTVPEEALSASVVVENGHEASNIVSPSYDHHPKKFVEAYLVTSSGEGEDLHFPILEDHFKAKNGSLSGAIPADHHSIVVKSRVENRRHLNELITTSAEVIRLLRDALGDWTVDFSSSFKIAIPAVKIAGDVDAHLDLVNIESVCDDLLQVVPDICLVPDSCLSLMEKKTMPFPEAFPGLVPSASRSVSADAGMMAAAATDVLMSATAASYSDESVPGVSTDESGDDEEADCNDLGEFLLDAVQWLL
ncbi:hypothetical protein ACHAW5_009796, partial [Stephanodiscus triporus]